MDSWLIAVIAVVAVIGSLSLWAATRGRAGRPVAGAEHAEEATRKAKGRDLSPREKLARDGGIASFGLNLPWWTRTGDRR